jgi:hypothetical protein
MGIAGGSSTSFGSSGSVDFSSTDGAVLFTSPGVWSALDSVGLFDSSGPAELTAACGSTALIKGGASTFFGSSEAAGVCQSCGSVSRARGGAPVFVGDSDSAGVSPGCSSVALGTGEPVRTSMSSAEDNSIVPCTGVRKLPGYIQHAENRPPRGRSRPSHFPVRRSYLLWYKSTACLIGHAHATLSTGVPTPDSSSPCSHATRNIYSAP